MASRESIKVHNGQKDGRRAAKLTTKAQIRRRERDRDHDLVRRCRGGIGDLEDAEGY